MLTELKKFYDNLEAKQEELLSKDVESIVAERVAKLAETIRQEVESEITAEKTVLDIKKQAISEAMEILQLKAAEKVSIVNEFQDVSLQPQETETN